MSQQDSLPLKLSGGSHAIKEVALTFFLASPIIKPDRFRKLLTDEFSNDFNRFQQISEAKIAHRQVSDAGAQAEMDPDAGFELILLDKGEVVQVLQGRNEEERTFVAYHTLRYKRWNNFLEDFNRLFHIIAPLLSNMAVLAFSLNYVDELEWTDTSSYKVSEVFNNNATYIPLSFFKNTSGQFTLTAEDTEDGFEHYDRLQVSSAMQENKAVIVINHNIIHRFQRVAAFETAIDDADVLQMIVKAHNHNKNVLKDILKRNVQDIIGLK